MPSLDQLQSQKNLNNLKIFPINVGQDNLEKASKFFEDLGIDNLKIYFDSPNYLSEKVWTKRSTHHNFDKQGWI